MLDIKYRNIAGIVFSYIKINFLFYIYFTTENVHNLH